MKDKCEAYESCGIKRTRECHEMCPMYLRRLEYNENDPIHLKTDKCGWKEGKFTTCSKFDPLKVTTWQENNLGVTHFGCCGLRVKESVEPIIKKSVFSMNDDVYFKIHSGGHKILDKYAEHVHRDNPKLDIQVKWQPYKKDWYREQLHIVFFMFGDKSFSGSLLPIYDLTFEDPTFPSDDERTRPKPKNPIVKKSSETWVARYEGIDYLKVTKVDQEFSPLFWEYNDPKSNICAGWKPISEIEIKTGFT